MPDNKKQLSEEELNKVSGGSTTENAPQTASVGSYRFTGFVGKYAETHVGEFLYLVDHDGEHYYYGRLLDSFEAEYTFSTERTQVINCVEKDGKSYYGIVEVSGDDYWLYREKVGI